MSSDDAAAIAGQDPVADGRCRYCGAWDPRDKPTRHRESCAYAQALEEMDRRWEERERWRYDALARLDAIGTALRTGQAADQDEVEAAVAALEGAVVARVDSVEDEAP